MRKAVARDGNIRLVYKDWPIFGAQSERAAKVALAADRQGIYPSVHHALMHMPVDGQSMRRAERADANDGSTVAMSSPSNRRKDVRDAQVSQ